MITADTSPTPVSRPVPRAQVLRQMARRSYAVLASTSPAGRAHSAGVIYALDDDDLWISTMRASRKARNIAANPHVAVTIPIRRVPVGGPPSAVMFQARAAIVDLDDHDLLARADAGRLRAITGHGELELDGGCVLRIALPRRLLTYGLGMSLPALIRNPLDAMGHTITGAQETARPASVQ